MSKFERGDTVYVPASCLPNPNQPFALVKRKVERLEGRSVVVQQNGEDVKIASARTHDRRLGFLVVKVGDLSTEDTLLNPLARSVLEFLRLLLPDDHVRRLDVRTTDELEAFWRSGHGAYSHVVLIGHADGSTFGFVNGVRSGAELSSLFGSSSGRAVKPKQFMSLACSTGRAAFAKPFSSHAACGQFVGPYEDVHGATASHFCQSYFAGALLQGRASKTAFNKAAELTMGSHFRLWRGGKLVAGKRL